MLPRSFTNQIQWRRMARHKLFNSCSLKINAQARANKLPKDDDNTFMINASSWALYGSSHRLREKDYQMFIPVVLFFDKVTEFSTTFPFFFLSLSLSMPPVYVPVLANVVVVDLDLDERGRQVVYRRIYVRQYGRWCVFYVPILGLLVSCWARSWLGIFRVRVVVPFVDIFVV